MRMTEINGHLICNTCGRQPVAVGSDAAAEYETVEWEDGDAVHVCPRCRADRDAGRLAVSINECAECHCDELSGEDEWHQLEDDAGRIITYCGDCWATRND